ncbi:hypothetical protein CTAM01_09172, partial [Colletotrichum tamarilloi]
YSTPSCQWLRPKSAIQSAYIRLPVCNQSAPIRQYVDAGETRMWSVQVRSEPTASSRAWLAACVPRNLFPPPPPPQTSSLSLSPFKFQPVRLVHPIARPFDRDTTPRLGLPYVATLSLA